MVAPMRADMKRTSAASAALVIGAVVRAEGYARVARTLSKQLEQ
jgi:hypothetical protein